MAVGMATRCPACATVFRVVPDQLRVSDGWVRCGRCTEVFNAGERLVDLQTGEPQRLPEPANLAPLQPASRREFELQFAPQGSAAPAGRLPVPVPVAKPAAAARLAAAVDAALAAPATTAGPAAPHADTEAPATEFPATRVTRQPAADEPDLDAPGDRPDGDGDEPAPSTVDSANPDATTADAMPSFLQRADRAARWQRPGVRAALAVSAVLASAALAGQLIYEWRDIIAARAAFTRPLLDEACAALGCSVGAARAIDGLLVDSSGLVRVERSSVYKLSVALRNRAAIDLALPALDLQLTDVRGQLLARRVLRLAELGVSQRTIGAGRDLAVQATLQADFTPAADVVAGYTIELFYP